MAYCYMGSYISAPETVKTGVWLRMARMEMDYNLKIYTFQVVFARLQQIGINGYGLFSQFVN